MLNRSLRTSDSGSELRKLGDSVTALRTRVRDLDQQLASLESDIGTGTRVPTAGPTVPGATPLGSAIRSPTSLAGASGATAPSPELQQLELSIQQIGQQLVSISNLLRSRQDAARPAIRNLKA